MVSKNGFNHINTWIFHLGSSQELLHPFSCPKPCLLLPLQAANGGPGKLLSFAPPTGQLGPGMFIDVEVMCLGAVDGPHHSIVKVGQGTSRGHVPGCCGWPAPLHCEDGAGYSRSTSLPLETVSKLDKE